MKKRFKIISFILIMTFIIPMGLTDRSFMNNTAYASGTNQINPRGLVFTDGMASDQIRLLKDFFRARGDKNVPWGYDYDARTKELVRSYQSEKKLGADGIAGKATIDSINREIREKGYSIGLREPSTGVKGDMLIINKSSNTLYFMKNGRVYKSFPVATGKQAGLTPDGRHTVIRKFKNPGWGGAGVSAPIPGGAPNNPLGKRWIGLSVGGGGKYGVHGNANAKSIGKFASLGCVRMFNEDVEKLYDEVKMNTPVWIGKEGTLIKFGLKFTENIPTNTGTKPGKKEDVHLVQPDVKVKLNGEKVSLKQPIINNNGTTYYPFREILEKIGAEVSWNQDTRTAIGDLDGNKVEFKLNSNEYKVNGVKMNLPKGQKVFLNKSDRTYIPIRYAMEALGFKVDWNQDTKTIIIDKIIKDDDIEKPVEPDKPIEVDDKEEIKPVDKDKEVTNEFVDDEYFKNTKVNSSKDGILPESGK